MTDRDHFAAAALTGLLASDPTLSAPDIWRMSFNWADAMLRERCRSGGDCPCPDNAPNHGAAPAARAPEPEPGPAARRRPAGGTGDTQSFDAYRRFVGEVMNWISEATSAYAASCGSDGGRNIMADACSRCWDAFDRIAHPTIHGAAPAARASVDSVVSQPTTHGDSDRTDNAAPRPSEGTGDTPEPQATPGEGSEPREGTQEPVAWGVAGLGGVLATSISRRDAVDMQGDYEFVTEVVPLYCQASDFAPPPPDNAAKAHDNAEPVAWAVCCPGDGNWSPCFFHEPHAQRHASAILGSKNVIPLYRQPPCQDSSQKNLTLTDAEREALERAVDSIASTMPYENQQGVDDWKTLRGLLKRMGGGG